MAGNPRRWARVEAGEAADVIGTAINRRIGGNGSRELVPVFLVTDDDTRHDTWTPGPDAEVWTVRCPRCGRLHRHEPRTGEHAAQCPFMPRAGMVEGPGAWTTCYLVRSLAQAAPLPGWTPAPRTRDGRTLAAVGL